MHSVNLLRKSYGLFMRICIPIQDSAHPGLVPPKAPLLFGPEELTHPEEVFSSDCMKILLVLSSLRLSLGLSGSWNGHDQWGHTTNLRLVQPCLRRNLEMVADGSLTCFFTNIRPQVDIHLLGVRFGLICIARFWPLTSPRHRLVPVCGKMSVRLSLPAYQQIGSQ